ncbi:MAG: hypothetical protein JHC21_04045 [Thermocrinis sp.]|nr:hypothetical protein [Thermocrinis sp.]
MAERGFDLRLAKAYWLLVAHHFDGLLIDFSLFDFKRDKRPKVRQGVKQAVPVERAYEEMLELLDEYRRGKDILWRPSFYYKGYLSSATTTLIWVNNFHLKNPYGIVPLFSVQVEESKHQSYFKLKFPVSIEEADRLQKELARHLGDITAGSFFQHRQIAGLANGKYEDDPIAKFSFSWKMVYLTPQEIYSLRCKEDVKEPSYEVHPQENGDVLIPVVNVEGNYKSFPIDWWEHFLEIKGEDIDDTTTDLAWATYMAKRALQAGWDEITTTLTVLHYLKNYSLGAGKRRKIPQLLWDYLFKTVWKAMNEAKKEIDPSLPKFVFRISKGSAQNS